MKPADLLNEGASGIIAEAIEWLWTKRGVRFGKRKLAQLLVGSSNKTAMDMGFHECPHWGALSFLSVRKAERMLASLLDQGFLETGSSPKMGLDVVIVNPRWAGKGPADISLAFRSESELPLGEVDRGLFATLSEKRREIAAENKHRDRPDWVCSDRFLIEMCIRKPKTIKDARAIRGAPERHTPAILEAALQYEQESVGDSLEGQLSNLNKLLRKANLQNEMDDGE